MATSNTCIILILFSSFQLLSIYYVDGVKDDILLTKEDELQIDNQLKRLNKPAIKTIKTEHGDLYDCVDFYKQPAFDHPLLTNHSFHPQMRPSGPSSLSKRIRRDLRSKDTNIGLVRVGCPFGTVPIRRVTKEDLVRAKLHEKRYVSSEHYRILTDGEPGRHYAFVRTKFDPNKKYNGGNAFITVYNVSLQNSQYSSARMRIQIGTDFIEVGSMTNPIIYNDLTTRIFIRTKTSKMDCFNLQCPGFVLVDKGLGIDPVVKYISTRGNITHSARFSIYKANDGNWWFELDTARHRIGFWPGPIFEGGSQGSATSLDWGGEVFGPVDIPSPPMGSSATLKVVPILDGHCEEIKVVDEMNKENDAENTEKYVDGNYLVADDPLGGRFYRHIMYFGGPGGYIGN